MYRSDGAIAMMQKDVLIINKLGLHARASARLTQLASSFKCEVMLSRGERRVNAKSIMGVMMLAAAKGTTINIETDGEDEADAMQALLNLINNFFGEGE
jgi:phosphocarrier protein